MDQASWGQHEGNWGRGNTRQKMHKRSEKGGPKRIESATEVDLHAAAGLAAVAEAAAVAIPVVIAVCVIVHVGIVVDIDVDVNVDVVAIGVDFCAACCCCNANAFLTCSFKSNTRPSPKSLSRVYNK